MEPALLTCLLTFGPPLAQPAATQPQAEPAPTPVEEAQTRRAEGPERGHGPTAPDKAFGHRFQLRAHMPERAQLSFHFGLIQPILLAGFNAAVDVRYKRFVATYSHGHGLDIDRVDGVRSEAEVDAGVKVFEPYTTGFGVGLTIIDELYVLADFKLHGFEVTHDGTVNRYQTITIGGEIGYRLFLWKGLHIAPVIRYWPTVWTSLPDRTLVLDEDAGLEHRMVRQGLSGLFFNVLLGWSFSL